MSDLNMLKSDFLLALLGLDRVAARRIVLEVSANRSPQFVAETLIADALTELGKMWEEGKAALSQVYMSGRICEELVNCLLASPVQPGQEEPKIAIAVLDDYHMLGKRIVYSVLQASGVALKDYGRMSADDIVTNVIHDDISILLVSVLMLPSALNVKALKAKMMMEHPETKVVVGRAPFRLDNRLWEEVEADAFGWNASDAIKIVKEIGG